MMELSDRHYRYLARLLSRHALLYTEMLTSKAVIHGDKPYLLDFSSVEHPLVLQLGGCDPIEMAEAAAIGEAWGYDEINMNVGCPSDRVKSGRFGACLMAEPETVAACVKAMSDAVKVPVSVKCRLGIDRDDSYDALESFVRVVREAGCRYFIVHARKAWLDGLSPKENRTIPPLRYEYVYRLKNTFPDLHITINGGIVEWDEVCTHLNYVDGVMSGRKAYYEPAFLAHADERVFQSLSTEREGESSAESNANNLTSSSASLREIDLAEVARAYAEYIQPLISQGVKPTALTRHLVGLYHNVPGARLWRRHISESASKCVDAPQLVEQALQHVIGESN